jgi:hypothetical protein
VKLFRNAAIAVLVTGGLVAVPAPAARAAGPAVDVVIDLLDGAGFVDGAAEGLFDPADLHLVPGAAVTRTVLVANRGSSSGRLSVRAVGVADHENGCSEPEAREDITCGNDDGEMRDALTVKAFVDVAGGSGFPAVAAWQGSFADLASGVEFDRPLDPAGIWGLALELTLPADAGNQLQTDDVTFALAFALTEDALAQATALTPDTPLPVGATGGAEVQGGSLTSDTVIAGQLPRTGIPVAPLAASGAVMVLSGWLLRRGVRSRRRRA